MKTRFYLMVLLAMLLPARLAGAAVDDHVSYFAKLNASALQPGQTAVLAIIVDIKPGLHAQSHTPLGDGRIAFEVTPTPNPALDYLEPIYPPGTIDDSPALGKQSIYTGRVIVYLPIRVRASAVAENTTLAATIQYQICNDRVCFKPEYKQQVSLPTQFVAANATVTLENAQLFSGFDQSILAKGAVPLQSQAPARTAIQFFGLDFSLGSHSFGIALLVALAVGVMFNLVPCVLPVLPLKAIGFFEVSRHSRGRCLALGTVFSLGVVMVFAILAMLLVTFRHALNFSWGEQFKYGWFVWSIVAILVVMALGMFGLFEVVLPNAVYSLTPRHDTFGGNFLFGMLTAVLSTPCTAPMFAGLLAWSLTQPTALGVATVITVGVGMALPYLILSAFPEAARWVPRTGPWSAVLKQMMGFLVLAVAVYFAGGRLASSKIFFWAVFAVVAAAMVFLVVRSIQLSRRTWPIFASAIAAVAVIWITVLLTLRLTGGLEWKPYSPEALKEARATGKPVLVEFTANWCGNCLALEATVYHDPQTVKAINDRKIILLRADLTATDAPGWDIVNQLNPGGGIPLTAIYGPGKNEPVKLTSLYTTENLLDAMGKATGAGGV